MALPDQEHPRGTLALVALLGLFFGLGWLAMYVWVFLARGATHS
jgi:Cytochrome c oxidase subunit IIa family